MECESPGGGGMGSQVRAPEPCPLLVTTAPRWRRVGIACGLQGTCPEGLFAERPASFGVHRAGRDPRLPTCRSSAKRPFDTSCRSRRVLVRVRSSSIRSHRRPSRRVHRSPARAVFGAHSYTSAGSGNLLSFPRCRRSRGSHSARVSVCPPGNPDATETCGISLRAPSAECDRWTPL